MNYYSTIHAIKLIYFESISPDGTGLTAWADCMGCFVRGGKSMLDVLSGVSKNGMGCFVLGCFVLNSYVEHVYESIL